VDLRHRGVHKADLLFDPFCIEDREEDERKTRQIDVSKLENQRFDVSVDNYVEFASSIGVYGACANKEYALHLLQVTRGDLEVYYCT